MRFEVIAEIDPHEDYPVPYERLEDVNAELGGRFSVLAHNESGEGLNSTWYLVVEVDSDD